MEIIEVNEKKEGTDIDYYNNVSNPASLSQTNKRCCHISGHCWLCTNNKGKLNKRTNKQNFQAADYWASVPTTIDGMLGGFAKISHTDIDGSNKLLKSLFKVEVMTLYIMVLLQHFTDSLSKRWREVPATQEPWIVVLALEGSRNTS